MAKKIKKTTDTTPIGLFIRKAQKKSLKAKANNPNAVSRLIELSSKLHPTAADINEIKDIANNSPEAQAHIQTELRKAQTGENQARYSPVLKTLLSLGGVGASLNQVNLANQLRGSLVQPGIPSAPGVDPALNQQIFNAQRGTLDAGKAAFAGNVGINDAYNQAVQDATNTAAGQAGTRQALINSANLRKMRSSVGMLPELDAIRAREEGRSDNLVGQRAQLAQENYRNQLAATGMGLEQYNKNAAAIGALGATGYENLFGQLGDFSDNAIPAMSAFSNPYTPTGPSSPGYTNAVHKRVSSFKNAVDNSLKATLNSPPPYMGKFTDN
ncbi:MAG: hypothetical protein KGJ87_11810 [Planctomycetota bacterium]|nr:hypothetical protein [Planctomycetota bacterium]